MTTETTDEADVASKAIGSWIPISKRWPDERVSVLVFTEKGMAVCEWEFVNGRRWWTPTSVNAEYGYECFLASHNSNNCDTAATHWMPLPEEPHGKR